ncbi:MAG: CHASE2 domain-containing protein [Pseudoxanthomonas sp.]
MFNCRVGRPFRRCLREFPVETACGHGYAADSWPRGSEGGGVSEATKSQERKRCWWLPPVQSQNGVGMHAFCRDWKAAHPLLVRATRCIKLSEIVTGTEKKWLAEPKSLPIRVLDAGLPVLLGMLLLGQLMNLLEPFGLDKASKAQSQRITARIMAPFYHSAAQDHIAVVMIDDHTLEARGIGWPPQYAYYDEMLRRILAQRPRAVYLDILMQQRRSYDDSYEDARLGIGEEIAAAGIPVYFGVAAPGGTSIFSGAGGARDVVTSWQGEGSDYPLTIDGKRINEHGQTLRQDAGQGPGADNRSVALALYDAACPLSAAGCGQAASELSQQARAQPLVVQWGSTLPRCREGAADENPCARSAEVSNGARMVEALKLLRDSFNSGRDEQIENRKRREHAYTFTLFEEQLDDEVMRGVLTDRVVLVGTHLVGLDDRVVSPVHQQIPGVYLHAMALDNLMNWGERRLHRTKVAGWFFACANVLLLTVVAGMVLVWVSNGWCRFGWMAVLTLIVGGGLAVLAQACWRQPPQDWLGMMGLALAVTYYVANLGQHVPNRKENGDEERQGEVQGIADTADAGVDAGIDMGVERSATEGAGDSGNQ